MAVTIRQIAEAAGVSRGTVDRALNYRKDINKQQAERIRRIAGEMGYRPNRMGRALALSKNHIKIGVLIQFAHTAFMQKIMKGVDAAIEEMQRFQVEVIVKLIEDNDTDQTVIAMEQLRSEGCRGIAMVPWNEKKIRDKIDEFAREGISIVTVNGDIADSERICFVGQDGFRSGCTAAGLMAEVLPLNKDVLIISGSPANTSNSNRAEGFRKEITKIRPDVKNIYIEYAFESNETAESICRKHLAAHAETGGIYLTAAGVKGVCKVLEEKKLTGIIKVISNDLTDENTEQLKKGNVQFLLGQDPFSQGYRPIQILFEKLVDGHDPEVKEEYTSIEIKTKYNL